MTTLNPPYAVIFDFDGVLFESEQLHFEALARVFAENGVNMTWAEYAEKYVGLSDREIIERLVRDHPELIDIDRTTALDRKGRFYEALTREGIRPIDGARELISRLRSDAVPMAICSGSRRDEIERLLHLSGLAANFDAIVATEDVSASKPSPEGYRLALQQLRAIHPSLSAGQCVVLEDAAAGILAAKTAGMRAVALRKTYGDAESAAPQAVISTFGDVTPAFIHGLIVAPSS
ncbi:MAG: HAD family phosphatase [Phycisphaerales bacterium]|nr:HAD family phosphatase [Phycisphaerales bacterium]MCB9856617.1 HAD family phosphatase [Phycisphaerales bacterium]